jgi:lysophospholipase L1-like esterase
MNVRSGSVFFAAALMLGACAGEDPFAGEGDSSSGGTSDAMTTSPSTSATTTAATTATTATTAMTTSDSADATDDGPGTEDGTDDGPPTTGEGECLPAPTRVVVLGDSIFTCVTAGGPDAAGCATKIVHNWVTENVGPTGYENYAVNGAVTHDIPDEQLAQIPVGMPGHTLVLIYVGGNDLSEYIFASDEDTVTGYMEKRPELDANWADVFAFLQDPANFPDGTTIVMNTQYNPFDDCTAPPYNLSATKIDMLRMYNEDLVAKADANDNAYIADQHEPFLGHGHHYNVDTCPFYQPDADYWMTALDLIHPYGNGHVNIGDEMVALLEPLYAGC